MKKLIQKSFKNTSLKLINWVKDMDAVGNAQVFFLN